MDLEEIERTRIARDAERSAEDKAAFMHRGWGCNYGESRPVTGRWIGTRHGVEICAGLRRELISMIDTR